VDATDNNAASVSCLALVDRVFFGNQAARPHYSSINQQLPVWSERIDRPLIVLRHVTDADDIANLLTSESIRALDRLRALP
jgi:hypothetical protein